MKQLSNANEWLIPLLSFGVFVLSLGAYVFLEIAVSGKASGGGELLTVVQISAGSTVGSAAMARRK